MELNTKKGQAIAKLQGKGSMTAAQELAQTHTVDGGLFNGYETVVDSAISIVVSCNHPQAPMSKGIRGLIKPRKFFNKDTRLFGNKRVKFARN